MKGKLLLLSLVYFVAAFAGGFVYGNAQMPKPGVQNPPQSFPDSTITPSELPQTGDEDELLIPPVSITPTPSGSVSPTPTATPSPTGSSVPGQTGTATPTPTITPTYTPTPSPTPTIDQYFSINAFHYGFSTSLMIVSPGDWVQVTVNSTGGTHDWGVDEMPGSRTALVPNGQSRTVTFQVPNDASGDYFFYCSVSGHRALGMEGIFRVQ